jgi:cell wall-associated NlpC family hydrolase
MMTKRLQPRFLRQIACLALFFGIDHSALANDILLPSPSPAPSSVSSPASAPASASVPAPASNPATSPSHSPLGTLLGNAFGSHATTVPAVGTLSSPPVPIGSSTAKSDDKLADLIAEKLAAEVARNPGNTGNPVKAKLQNITQHATELVMQAMGMLGIHYKRGGSTPDSGLDCSGMVRYVFKQALGRDLPRSAAEISQVGKNVQTTELQPGDLVFYNTMRRGFSHVGIYLGDNKFIHSPSVGGQVRIESMDLAYWKKRFDGARRMDN